MSPQLIQEVGDFFKASPHLAKCKGGREGGALMPGRNTACAKVLPEGHMRRACPCAKGG